jgi:hypothetical protein
MILIIYLIGCYLSLSTYIANVENLRKILILENDSNIEFKRESKLTIILLTTLSWFMFMINLSTNLLFKSRYNNLDIKIIKWNLKIEV